VGAKRGKTDFVGKRDELCAVVATELGEDSGDVCLGG
jgi:hypothetical protein